MEAVDVSFSTVFIANVEETKPKFPLKVRYLCCRQLYMFYFFHIIRWAYHVVDLGAARAALDIVIILGDRR